MFDIGFSELLLFGVIALIVLGPEKLPQAARTAGQWYAKIRRTVSTLQAEIEAELDLAETRQQMQKELAKIRQTEADMRREMAEMRGSMQEFASAQNQHLKAAHNASVDNAQDNKIESDNQQISNQAATPKEFDYSYRNSEKNAPSKATGDSLKTDVPADAAHGVTIQSAQISTTRPWENMWFRLSAFDKARRLPVPPYLPNYKADILLNAQANIPLNQQASGKQQEND